MTGSSKQNVGCKQQQHLSKLKEIIMSITGNTITAATTTSAVQVSLSSAENAALDPKTGKTTSTSTMEERASLFPPQKNIGISAAVDAAAAEIQL
jgi:hypothetical protein